MTDLGGPSRLQGATVTCCSVSCTPLLPWGGGMKGREYGAIRVLRTLRRMAMHGEPMDAAVVDRSGHALDMLAELLALLPPGADLAALAADAHARKRRSIETPEAELRGLKRLYTNIETSLEACRNFTVSADTAAVEDAFSVLAAVAQGFRMAGVTRGDHIHAHFLGATLTCAHRNGRSWELSLRRGHPTYDTDPQLVGHWLLEGGAKIAPDRGAMPIEVPLGPLLPADVYDIITRHACDLDSLCAGQIRRLHAAG